MGKIYQAKMIITMDSSHPFATHVAIDGDKIVGLGDEEVKTLFPTFEIDSQFADKFMLPGFIEGHAHLLAGQDGLTPYVGYFDRVSPEGTVLEGLKSVDEIISYLQEVDKKTPAGEPIFALGLDPIYFDGPRISRAELDKVSTSRLVVIYHASGHLITANSKAVESIPEDKLNSVDGIVKDDSGKPTGEFRELKAMTLIFELLGPLFAKFTDPKVLFPRFAKLAQMRGVTTITDMGVDLNLDDPNTINTLVEVTNNGPIRLVPMYFIPTTTKKPEEIPDYVKSLKGKNTEKLRFGHVKMMADGSIQGYTARLKSPYVNGVENGIWNQDPENLKMFMKLFNNAELQVNCHCNGDEASEAFIEAVKEALVEKPWSDNRHTIQHAQMVDEKQFKEMKDLGMCANIFTNHIYYWGDQHVAKTIGPERANKMDAANIALTLGVPFSLHCDASVTPIDPLFEAWSAVNRITASGKVLGEEYKIPVEDALYAMTMGSAYLLKMENEIGSITINKKADFVILEEDPYTIDPVKLKDVKVVSTVLGGVVTN